MRNLSCRTILGYGCMEPICALLDARDTQIQVVALDALEVLLRIGETCIQQSPLRGNVYVELMVVV